MYCSRFSSIAHLGRQHTQRNAQHASTTVCLQYLADVFTMQLSTLLRHTVSRAVLRNMQTSSHHSHTPRNAGTRDRDLPFSCPTFCKKICRRRLAQSRVPTAATCPQSCTCRRSLSVLLLTGTTLTSAKSHALRSVHPFKLEVCIRFDVGVDNNLISLHMSLHMYTLPRLECHTY